MVESVFIRRDSIFSGNCSLWSPTASPSGFCYLLGFFLVTISPHRSSSRHTVTAPCSTSHSCCSFLSDGAKLKVSTRIRPRTIARVGSILPMVFLRFSESPLLDLKSPTSINLQDVLKFSEEMSIIHQIAAETSNCLLPISLAVIRSLRPTCRMRSKIFGRSTLPYMNSRNGGVITTVGLPFTTKMPFRRLPCSAPSEDQRCHIHLTRRTLGTCYQNCRRRNGFVSTVKCMTYSMNYDVLITFTPCLPRLLGHSAIFAHTGHVEYFLYA